LTLDGGECLVSHITHFTPRERDPGTHLVGGWVDQHCLDAVAKRKKSLLLLGIKPLSSSP